MPVRYGINFPAWFNPQYPPIEPIQPKAPVQQYTENKHVKVCSIYVKGLDVSKLIDLLNSYNSEEYFINGIEEYDNCLEIMKIEKCDVILDDKEFTKRQKEYIKAIKDYERIESEFRMRVQKYPELLFLYEDAKLREFLVKAEDDLEETKIQDSISQKAILDLTKSIEEAKIQLKNLENKYKKQCEN